MHADTSLESLADYRVSLLSQTLRSLDYTREELVRGDSRVSTTLVLKDSEITAADLRARLEAQQAKVESFTRPLGDERILLTRAVTSSSSPTHQASIDATQKEQLEITLGASFREFAGLIKDAELAIADLVKEYETTCAEIDDIVSPIVGDGEHSWTAEDKTERQALRADLSGRIQTMSEESIEQLEKQEKDLRAREKNIKRTMLKSLENLEY